MKYKLLIVDDLPENIKLLAHVLANEGFYIEFATSGKEALECLNAETFDLVLLDIMMPELNGFETCQIIKSNPLLKDIPILFLTAITDIESIKEGFKAGGIDYITKPFNPEELLVRINTHLELKNKSQLLKDMNLTLEKKVNERTSALEEALDKLQVANEELLKLDDAKNNFLKIVSHELRTPLNSILGFTELIQDNPDSEDLPLLINGLNRAAWRLEKLSYTALHITKLKINADQIDFEKVSLRLITESALVALKNANRKMECQFEFDDIEKKTTVLGDKILLQQCIFNMLDNAQQHSNYCKIKVIENEKNQIIYQIKDNGSGFNKTTLKNPFKLFSPGHTFINKNAGLGLALSKLIMEAHKSTIVLENAKEGGAIVNLIFNVT